MASQSSDDRGIAEILSSLPKEISTKEAEEFFGLPRWRILDLINRGILVARDISLRSSYHRNWRIPLDAAIALRGEEGAKLEIIPHKPTRRSI